MAVNPDDDLPLDKIPTITALNVEDVKRWIDADLEQLRIDLLEAEKAAPGVTQAANRKRIVELWREMKAAEAAVKAIAEHLHKYVVRDFPCPDEGRKSTKLDNGFTVTLEGKINRKLDKEAWEKIRDEIPTDRRPVKTKTELDEKGVKWLRENEPEIYKKVAQAIIATPGKTAVTIKEPS